MAKRIVVQAGHQNTKNNVDPALHGSTGAPGEVAFTVDVANQVSAELRKRGFEVLQTDANFNSDPKRTQDYDLYLACHYEADVHNTNGFFAAIPEPSTDAATQESARIAQVIAQEYKTLGIPERPQWQNANTKFYYMWKYLSAKTPCVLLECGVGWRVPKDHDLLNTEKRTTMVVPAIVKGICKAFNVPYEITPPQPPTDWKKKYEEQVVISQNLQTKLNEANAKLDKAKTKAQEIISI